MREYRNEYHFKRKQLSKILSDSGFIHFKEDQNILNRILEVIEIENDYNKVKDIILSTVITKYGQDISDQQANLIISEIKEWSN